MAGRRSRISTHCDASGLNIMEPPESSNYEVIEVEERFTAERPSAALLPPRDAKGIATPSVHTVTPGSGRASGRFSDSLIKLMYSTMARCFCQLMEFTGSFMNPALNESTSVNRSDPVGELEINTADFGGNGQFRCQVEQSVFEILERSLSWFVTMP